MADARAGQGILPDAQHRSGDPLSRSSAPPCSAAAARRATTPSPGAIARAASALGVDIIENCEVKAIRRDASGAVSGVETTRGADRDQEDRRRRRRPHQRRHGDGRRAHAARIVSAAGAGLRAAEAGDALRRDVEHHPRLYVAVGQGRTGHRRGDGRLRLLQPDRRTAHRHADAGGDLRDVPDRLARCA